MGGSEEDREDQRRIGRIRSGIERIGRRIRRRIGRGIGRIGGS